MGLKSKVRDWFIRRGLNNQAKEGTILANVWTWLNGKKLVLGAIITIVGSIVAALPVLLPLFIQDAAQVTQIVGVALAIVGFLHKVYKFIYKEDHE